MQNNGEMVKISLWYINSYTIYYFFTDNIYVVYNDIIWDTYTAYFQYMVFLIFYNEHTCDQIKIIMIDSRDLVHELSKGLMYLPRNEKGVGVGVVMKVNGRRYPVEAAYFDGQVFVIDDTFTPPPEPEKVYA